MMILNLKARLRVACVCVLMGASAATSTSALARDAVMEVTPKTGYPTAPTANLKSARDAIVLAATGLGWELKQESPNQLTLHHNKQEKHLVTIAVDYDAAGYMVRYVDSLNLNYSVGQAGEVRIHPTYNRWVRNLIKQINAQPIEAAQ